MFRFRGGSLKRILWKKNDDPHIRLSKSTLIMKMWAIYSAGSSRQHQRGVGFKYSFFTFFIVTFLFTSPLTHASSVVSTGEIKGRVTNAATGEALPFANVAVKKNGDVITGSMADEHGNYRIRGIQPGEYSLEASFAGMKTTVLEGLLVTAGGLLIQDIEVGMLDLPICVVRPPVIPLDPSNEFTLTPRDIAKIPVASSDPVSYAPLAPGVFPAPDGSGLYIRGARKESTQVYIDGMKVIGSTEMPGRSINQVTVLTGGIPAEYGDLTGGLILITTNGYFNR
ncbi:MAG: carboxypeptidase regulatory-like domain-containing protein [Flavobacteriales bacterium]|nr:carboxypeptidase regulatory-like domain-containing protein [Flavobacteriales bacterium]